MDEELARYAKGRIVLSVLGLRSVYYRLLRDRHGRDALWASAVARRLAPDDPDLPGRIRDSALRVGAYQIWSDVRRNGGTLHMAGQFAAFVTLVCVCVGVTFYTDGSLSQRLPYATATSFATLVVFVVGFSTSELCPPVSRTARALLGLLGLGALMITGWWLLRWQTIWGLGLSSGVFIGAAALFLLGLLSQIGRLLTHAAYRVSWTRWTSAEITETLAEAHWWLSNEPEPRCLRIASDNLEHVANCVERFLPHYLTEYASPVISSALAQRAQHEFAGIAAQVRILAKECLLPKATTRVEATDKVADLLVTAAQERWGEWGRAVPEEIERSARWRRLLSGVLRFGLGLFPLVSVAAGALFVYKANPGSPFLKPEVLVPVLVATFGFFTTVLGPGSSSERERPGGRRKPFHGRDRS
ncbi:hypothetical protein CF165_05850 [Amycolatopsis vastitatis]|uniref:Uncharacterized protein n=2 Tax=Amycolatopsis vastitatis TaxID=1905142 RepID=A0A229TI24_9PSEU|nr:hypothetical protein CF165_05850 [Amycolatopsis vastitatis]